MHFIKRCGPYVLVWFVWSKKHISLVKGKAESSSTCTDLHKRIAFAGILTAITVSYYWKYCCAENSVHFSDVVPIRDFSGKFSKSGPYLVTLLTKKFSLHYSSLRPIYIFPALELFFLNQNFISWRVLVLKKSPWYFLSRTINLNFSVSRSLFGPYYYEGLFLMYRPTELSALI